ncbi:MAG: hypothetical protein JNM84_08510 [Planctomycetes bacterium]|nr:hypothetical protein [Planctomycetota bacterium]
MKHPYVDRAERAGIGRPMQLLLRAPESVRRHLAALLGLGEYVAGMSVEEECWTLLSLGRKGIRARTHTFFERINPFAPCATWQGILERTASFYGLPICAEPREMERRIFEHFSQHALVGMDPEELSFLDALRYGDARLRGLVAREELSPAGMRMAAATVYHWAVDELVSIWGGTARLLAQIHRPSTWARWISRLRGPVSWLLRFRWQRELVRRPLEFVETVVLTRPVHVVPVIMALYLCELLGKEGLAS